MPTIEPTLRERLEAIEQRICAAAERARRNREHITLVAVTKKFSADRIRDGYQAGLRHFGENYVQEFAGKQPLLPDLADARYHMIGRLQRNKAGQGAALFDFIHTVDSVKLLERLDHAATEMGKPIEALIEVKLSNEPNKTGVAPEAIPELVAASRNAKTVRLTGLMTMPPWSEYPEESRPYFTQLAALAAQYDLPQLSMGMSNDFEVAVEEGATLVRLGTALFGPRPKPVVGG